MTSSSGSDDFSRLFVDDLRLFLCGRRDSSSGDSAFLFVFLVDVLLLGAILLLFLLLNAGLVVVCLIRKS